jgi:hypothetical protein
VAIKEYPIIGFQPDLPASTPGVITTSTGILPTDRGIGTGVTVSAISGAVSTAYAGAVLTQLDGTQRVFLGTATKLYELVSTTATDRSSATYAASNWTFAAMGNIMLAASKADGIFSINAGSAFAAVSGAPKATIIIAPGLPASQFAMAFDYNDGTNNYQDGIFWSALADSTDWTPSIATQCGNVRLIDVSGPFTAAIPFRDGVVAFKANAMYLGQYVGGSDMWAWTRISNQVGCLNANAVCEAQDVLYFADKQGLWVFDGSYPQRMPGAIQQWWRANAAISGGDTKLTWDANNRRLWIAYGDNGFGAFYYIAFNPVSQLWTQYGTLSSTTSFLIGATASGSPPLYVYDGHFSKAIPSTGTGLNQSFTLGAHGDTYGMTTVRSIRPEWLVGGSDTDTTWCTAKAQYGPSLRNLSTGTAANATMAAPGRFDVMKSARYIQPVIAPSIPFEVQKIAVDLVSGGAE